MSIKIMSWVWDNSPYSGSALLLHLALADYANDSGECWPSQVSLAAKARCSERYVRTTTSKMVDDGFLEVVSASNGKSTHRYRLIARNSVPPRNSETPTPELSDNLTGTLLPKNHKEPSRTINKCPYCNLRLHEGKTHDCGAMNMRIR